MQFAWGLRFASCGAKLSMQKVMSTLSTLTQRVQVPKVKVYVLGFRAVVIMVKV